MSTNTTPTPVMGYLASNWTGLNEATPAVIVNPAARPLDLLAWCWAELQSMQAAADALVCSPDDINTGDFSAIIVHRIAPLTLVFEQALEKLRHEVGQGGAS